MKYFIAHLLTGDVARYHREITHTLSERFHTTALYKKVQSHLTVKIPFEANPFELAQVEDRLASLAASRDSVPLTFEGFGRFGFKTVYLDVTKSQRAVELVRETVNTMNELPWMQRIPHEGNKLHASVARFMTYKKFRRVWRHLRHERAYFESSLDSFAILKKEAPEHPWVVHRTFALGAPAEVEIVAQKPVHLAETRAAYS